MSAYAISRTTGQSPNSDSLSKDEIRQRIEDEITYRIGPAKNLIQGDTLNPLVQAELAMVVFTSTPPAEHDFMVARRRNVYAEFRNSNLEALFIQLAGLVKGDEQKATERARLSARRLDELLHLGPKRQIELTSSVVDDITVLTPPQITAVRDTLLPALGKWLR